ncbi:holliday junction resolvase [Proteus phage 10]|uniref:hypothetical protein n=1 Tax=Proteus mirabilis TaxID=584 RepID=UPI0015F20E15|nr:holliday junction resolvase [Proteus phage 10]
MIQHDVRPLQPLRIVAVDPGTETVGVSLLELCPVTLTKTLIESYTIHASALAYHWDGIMPEGYNREYRLQGIFSHLWHYFNNTHPTVVVFEDNYLRHSPKSYKALIESVCAIKQAVWHYNPATPFYAVTPMQAKACVNATKKASDKELVRKGLKAYTGLVTTPGYIDSLDEHSVDSVAIGLYACEQIEAAWKEITWTINK